MISSMQSEAGPSRISHVSSRPSATSRPRTLATVGRQGRMEDQTEEYEGRDSLDSSSAAVSASLASPRSTSRSTSSSSSSCSSSFAPRSKASSFTLLSFLATLALAFALISHAPMQASAQLVAAGDRNNLTSLAGTWSTGTARVSTGIGFYNPVNTSFNIPASAGQSYSFTDDGYWEQALYVYTSNPSRPSCVSASLFWQHGTYTINSNNSLTLTPFNGDGRQLTEDRCSSTSTTSTYYHQAEYMLGWDITLDLHFGRPGYRLQLYGFDGALKPLMWQTFNPPQMLPNELLVQTIYGATS